MSKQRSRYNNRSQQHTPYNRPKWHRDVDRWLFHYPDAQQRIVNLENRLDELEQDGQRIVMRYELMEGQRSLSPSIPVEDLAIRKRTIEEQIKTARLTVATVERVLDYSFRRDELNQIQPFIQWFWWTRPWEPERIRKAYVVLNLDWVSERQFRRIKARIYDRLGDILGFKPEEEEGKENDQDRRHHNDQARPEIKEMRLLQADHKSRGVSLA